MEENIVELGTGSTAQTGHRNTAETRKETTSPPPRRSHRGYECSRFNAVRHAVLSKHIVLAWEDAAEYQSLLGALVQEYAPQGPTELHLVEEIAGIIWR